MFRKVPSLQYNIVNNLLFLNGVHGRLTTVDFKQHPREFLISITMNIKSFQSELAFEKKFRLCYLQLKRYSTFGFIVI